MRDDGGCVLAAIVALVIVAAATVTCAKRTEYTDNGRFEERCHNRGGYWLPDSIPMHDTLSRCIEQPKPIMLMPWEKAP